MGDGTGGRRVGGGGGGESVMAWTSLHIQRRLVRTFWVCVVGLLRTGVGHQDKLDGVVRLESWRSESGQDGGEEGGGHRDTDSRQNGRVTRRTAQRRGRSRDWCEGSTNKRWQQQSSAIKQRDHGRKGAPSDRCRSCPTLSTGSSSGPPRPCTPASRSGNKHPQAQQHMRLQAGWDGTGRRHIAGSGQTNTALTTSER